MNIKNRKDIEPIVDACESLQEMYDSQNMSVSYATITNKAIPHYHKILEEVYYIVKGKGTIKIGDEELEIKSGDIIPIPKNTFHNIESVEETIELVVVTHPKFDKNDMNFE